MSGSTDLVRRLSQATPAEQSLHNNFVESVRIAKRSLLRCAFYLVEIVDRKVHKVLGFNDAASYAAEVAGLTHRQAKDLLRMGRHLRELPAMSAAVDNGSLSWNKARLVVARARPENEVELLSLAQSTSEQVIKAKLKTEAVPSQAEFKESKQFISLGFTPEQYARWEAVLAALRQSGRQEALAELHLAALENLLGKPQGPDARLPGYFITLIECPSCSAAVLNTSRGEVRIPRALLEAAGCDAIVERDRDGIITRRSVIPPALRRAVLRRDRYRCQAQDCRHVQHLEVHHRVPASHGGRTEIGNLITLCRRCHRLLHQREASLRQTKPPV
jgi:HNH endonuclease